ncbi:MAG: zf-HC2 domain-containing protein [Polyangiaceae bacterium]|nr:zf-HC2 domain-containing protein [Polyangiaceae bacterium]
MTCERVEPELGAFHFGVVDEAVRSEVEAHLLGCQHCLRELLALKRAVETAELAPQPSPLVHARLRRAMAEELHGPARRVWSWWERPLAFALAAATVVLALGATGAVAVGPGRVPHALRDR